MPAMNEEIQSISLHTRRHVIFHGYVAPFLVLYSAALYVWLQVYGITDYFEAGCIVIAVIAFLQILTCLFCQWFVNVNCALTCRKEVDPFTATLVKVIPTPNNGYTALVKLRKHYDSNTGKTGLHFEFQKMHYVFDDEEKKQFLPVKFPDDWTFQQYLDWKGYGETPETEAASRNYWKNSMVMDIPSFMELYKERATAPFFVFQVFCVGLWCLDEYWYYSVFTLFMLVMFEATLVHQQIRNMSTIRKMGNKPYFIQCYRNKRWRPISSNELYPGDIVSVGRSQEDRLIPCDLLLLRGSCIVDESMLTGESIPVMKESIEEAEGDTVLDLKEHSKHHVLFGGTKVVQHTAPSKGAAGMKAPDGGCVGFVVRNGFNTSQGKLLRTILFGVRQVTENNLETFCFILFLLIFAIAASAYLWIKGTEDPDRSRYKLLLECILILTSVVPPELPIELSLAVNTSLLALFKLHVFCTEPFRIPFAGKVDVCCFDKTGTLTSDDLVVQGVAGLGEDEKAKEILPVTQVPVDTTQVMATCHSLAMLEDHTLVGDPLEKATLTAIEWSLTKADAVVPSKGRGHGFKIFQRFHFSSALKRMSVICGHMAHGSTETQYWVTVKGAPETLRSMYKSVPDSYDGIYLSMARQGARVLALGKKSLGNLSHQEVRELKREDCEKDLEFCGFVIISCPLKPDSKSVVAEIKNASHHVTMITGDNALTACHVARELGISSNSATLLLELNDDQLEWVSVDRTETLPMDEDLNLSKLTQQYDLCVTGDSLSCLVKSDPDLYKAIIPKVKVFARVSPQQKEHIITSLKSLGFFTLMCGDGTNDVGALKHAHVGVALLANPPPSEDDAMKKSLRKDKSKQQSSDEVPNKAPPVQNKPAVKSGSGASKAAKMRAVGKGDPVPNSRQEKIARANERFEKAMEEMDREMGQNVVRLGDASIASPFTSKHSTTTCVCHIIKQGRCTLVTTLQMFKVLALNALVLAYSQSVLYLEGVKFSDTQATIQGLLLAGCFFFISRSNPLKTLSKERPLPNIFNLYTILTVMLQFSVHFTSLVFLYGEAEARSPPREGKFVDLEKKFEPNLINSTVYIIGMAMQLSTFAVNYKGHPFMASLSENRPLLYSLMFGAVAIVALASGVVPEIADQLEIVCFEPEFRNVILGVLVADSLSALIIDRTLQFLLGSGKLRN